MGMERVFCFMLDLVTKVIADGGITLGANFEGRGIASLARDVS